MRTSDERQTEQERRGHRGSRRQQGMHRARGRVDQTGRLAEPWFTIELHRAPSCSLPSALPTLLQCAAISHLAGSDSFTTTRPRRSCRSRRSSRALAESPRVSPSPVARCTSVPRRTSRSFSHRDVGRG
ncbi:hypothetical protein EJ04DRAFT_367209 [Polyplosphaeria fusca]|uniref:Uncharacterized protein n=1 Tax=Polyplosphaeria fusca TaxID=682080 RepID=A0A9P4QRU1_9PLEO|nr:hypothetical protein EJ04DRAFT_367209 [Polyplosphaeria fusca]